MASPVMNISDLPHGKELLECYILDELFYVDELISAREICLINDDPRMIETKTRIDEIVESNPEVIFSIS